MRHDDDVVKIWWTPSSSLSKVTEELKRVARADG
jgi:hypothetical protein